MRYQWKEEYQSQIARTGDAADAMFRDTRYILIAGHRGMKALYPENTLLSFSKAIEAGVDAMEMDVNMTKDLVPVVCHDLTLDRTTDGTGLIREHTFEEIRKLDAGCKFEGGAFAGKGLLMPSLEEYCELVKPYPYLLLNVEIKDKTPECADSTVAMLGAFGLLSRCVFTCFDAAIIHYLVDTYGVKTQGFLGHRMPHFVDGPDGTNSRLYCIGLGVAETTKESVQQVEDQGILAWSWCPDTEEDVQASLDADIRLMTCNDPYPAMKLVGALGKRMPH